MIKNIKAFQTTLNQSAVWINELMDSYAFRDENEAFVLLRATLKSLRDRIGAGEAYHLATQLPALLRGYYFEGWNPHKNPSTDRTPYDFLTSVRAHLGTHHDNIDLELAVPEALRITFEKIDQGEAEDVRQNLPREIQELCP